MSAMAKLCEFRNTLAMKDADWLNKLFEEQPEKTQRGLAAALGVDASAITRMKNRLRRIRVDEIPKIETYFAVIGNSPAELSNVTLEPNTGEQSQEFSIDNLTAWKRDLPVYGSALCGDGASFEMNGQIIDRVPRPPRLSGVSGAYALFVAGDSMYPWRKSGDLVYVHPHLPVSQGDYVVVQMKQQTGAGHVAYIKKLVRRTGTKIKLLQFNPSREVDFSVTEVEFIHRIVDWSEIIRI